MRGRIDGANGLVERARNDAVIDDEDGADGHLAGFQTAKRFFERGGHEPFVATGYHLPATT